MMNPPGPPPSIWGEALDVLPLEAFQAAKLEVGTKQDGVSLKHHDILSHHPSRV